MKKIIWMNICGKPYPMRCTLGAMEKLYETYTDIEGFVKALQTAGKSYTATMDALYIFISQGCAYMNAFESDEPDFPQGGYKPISRESLAVAFDLAEYAEISAKVQECLAASRHVEIEAKPVGNSKKKEVSEAIS